MSPPLLTDEQLAFLESLEKSGVEYMIMGMSAALLHGVFGTTQDIDLWVGPHQTDSLQKACRRVGGVYVWRANPPVVSGPGLDDFDLVWSPHGLRDFATELSGSENVEIAPGIVVKVLPLDRVIASKRAANRLKDRAQLPLLRDALKVLRGV